MVLSLGIWLILAFVMTIIESVLFMLVLWSPCERLLNSFSEGSCPGVTGGWIWVADWSTKMLNVWSVLLVVMADYGRKRCLE